jgi:hypothetical protein
MLGRISADELCAMVLIAFNAAIDVQLDQPGHTVGSLFKEDLHLVGAMRVIKQLDLSADQGHRCLEQLSVQRYRAVFGDFTPDPLSEVIGQVFGRRSQTFQVVGKPGKWCLAGTPVVALVVDTVEPYLERSVEFDERTALEAEHKIVAYGPEESLDFSLALGLVRFGVDQGNPQAGGYMFQVPAAERRTVVHI